MGIDVDVDIEDIDFDAEAEAEAVMIDAAKKAVPIAKRLVPVDTGTLRDSIERDGTTLKATADYAFYVHEGTAYQTGVPFLRRAMQLARDQT